MISDVGRDLPMSGSGEPGLRMADAGKLLFQCPGRWSLPKT